MDLLNKNGQYDPTAMLLNPPGMWRSIFDIRTNEDLKDEDGNLVEMDRPYGQVMNAQEIEQRQEEQKEKIRNLDWRV